MLRNAILVALSLCISGCNSNPPSTTTAANEGPADVKATPQEPGGVTVSAAASTKEVVEALASGFKSKNGVTVHVNAGPSSALANQILAGAPADLFLSASQPWADAVKQGGQAIESKRILTNKLVLVVPKGNPVGVKQPADLLAPAVKRIALAGEKVPAGTYADQALGKLGLLQKLVGANKIARGQDVRTALSYVERGEAEAGIVYSTDVAVANSVESVYEFDRQLHDEIVYVLLLLKAAEKNPAARSLFDFLSSPEAAVEFRKFGFLTLDDKGAP